jgi:hypothetical protein
MSVAGRVVGGLYRIVGTSAHVRLRATATMPASDIEAEVRAAKRCHRFFDLDSLAAVLDRVLSPAAGLFCPMDVEFFDPLGGIGQDRHLLGRYFNETAENDDRLFPVAFLDAEFAGGKGGNEGRVVRQDAECAIRAGRNHHVDIRLREDDALARYDLYI